MKRAWLWSLWLVLLVFGCKKEEAPSLVGSWQQVHYQEVLTPPKGAAVTVADHDTPAGEQLITFTAQGDMYMTSNQFQSEGNYTYQPPVLSVFFGVVSGERTVTELTTSRMVYQTTVLDGAGTTVSTYTFQRL